MQPPLYITWVYKKAIVQFFKVKSFFFNTTEPSSNLAQDVYVVPPTRVFENEISYKQGYIKDFPATFFHKKD